jgi:hypothetical protein
MDREHLRWRVDGFAIVRMETCAQFFPAPRCCAPGCGDKVKDGLVLVRLADGTVLYAHDSCCRPERLAVIDWTEM